MMPRILLCFGLVLVVSLVVQALTTLILPSGREA
jgi:hypothetical protein